MQFLIDKIIGLGIGWNERSLNEADFHLLCREFGVTVQDIPLNTAGFYYRLLGQDFIAVDSKLTGGQRLTVLFHEFAHYLFHTSETGPTAGFHHVGIRTRKEREADVFALCAILPRPVIERLSFRDLIDEGWPTEIVEERFEILRRYGV